MLFVPVSAQQHVRYKARHITMVEGLPSNSIHDFGQDSRGFLWMGGVNGLSRYDGYRFVRFNRFGENRATGKPEHIGLLQVDHANNLVWAITSTYKYGCYDLQRGRFLTMGTPEEENRGFNRYLYTGDGIILTESSFGVRRFILHDRELSYHDYNTQTGLLPMRPKTDVRQDAAGNLWVASTKGVTVIDSANACRALLKGKDILRCQAVDNKMVCLSRSDQTCYVYDTRMRLVGQARIPSALGAMDDVRDIISWQGRCLFFTPDGTFQLDLRTMTITRPADCQIPLGYLQDTNNGYQFVANRSGTLWIFPPKGGVRKLVLATNVGTTNEKNKLYTTAFDNNGRLYIATYGLGLFTYDMKTGELLQYTAQDAAPLINSNYLMDVLVDQSGCIWVASETSGLTCIQPITDLDATYYYIDATRKGDRTNYVRYEYFDKNGQLHASTMDKKLYRFDRSAQRFVFERDMKAGIYNYMVDRKGREWTCTRGDGLYVNGVRYAKNEPQHRLPSSDFFNTAEDARGRIWAATWDAGLLLLEVDRNGEVRMTGQYLDINNNARKVHDLELSPDGALFVATHNGIYAVDARKKTITAQDFHSFNTDNGLLPGNEVKTLKYAHGSLWAGIVSAGVVRCTFSQGLQRMTYSVYDQKDGMADNDVRTISGDRQGRLWVGGGSGLSCIDVKTGSIRRYAPGLTLASNIIAENSGHEMEDGRIMFGTENGLVVITPKQRDSAKSEALSACITDLRINGTSIYEGEDSALLDSALHLTPEIRLSHGQHSLTICYSNFCYRDIQRQLYQVRMDGVDEEWSRPTTLSEASYGNLAPGTYRFRVRALHDGQSIATCKETESDATLAIIIAEPWYNTGWAWTVYLLIIGLAGWYIFRNARERARLHQQVQVEKQVTEFRLNFFTHITHEFRTPLAIIQNGVSQLQDPINKTINKTALQTTQRGTKRLLRLVNQLMEFRKASTGNMKLGVQRGDIVGFMRQIWLDLFAIAKQEEKNYTFTPFDKHFEMAFDREFVETIVYNLLSNALKYTPTRGTVTLRLQHDGDKIIITVEDDGPGITAEQQRQLFQPFMHGYVSHGGMGIGLYTAHRLAALHHGSLSYERVTEKGGSRFTCVLPATDDVYSAEEYRQATAVDTTHDGGPLAEDFLGGVSAEALNRQRVAIIEDDPDMMQQINATIGTYFQTICFASGREGYDGVMREKPDLVVCDVMLPDMDGYEIIRRLKSDASLRTMPVIMLTALDDDAHQIRGYQAGADDYMVKPCNFRLLIARIIQLIKWREQNVQSVVAAESGTTDEAKKEPEGVIENRADKLFRQKVQMLVVQHLSEPSFSVDALAEMMCMGRSKFYGKMKEVCGMSPNKYIMQERMRIAAELIVAGELNITEISLKVGLQDPSHFNKSFKAAYGVSPSKYKG